MRDGTAEHTVQYCTYDDESGVSDGNLAYYGSIIVLVRFKFLTNE